MTDVVTLAQRLVNGLRMDENERPYRLERAEVETVGEAETWVWDWTTPNGDHTWRFRTTREAGHLRVARHWLFLRFIFRDEFAERGGR
jgi:hypothetical protein